MYKDRYRTLYEHLVHFDGTESYLSNYRHILSIDKLVTSPSTKVIAVLILQSHQIPFNVKARQRVYIGRRFCEMINVYYTLAWVTDLDYKTQDAVIVIPKLQSNPSESITLKVNLSELKQSTLKFQHPQAKQMKAKIKQAYQEAKKNLDYWHQSDSYRQIKQIIESFEYAYQDNTV